jgi:hypothetical protein
LGAPAPGAPAPGAGLPAAESQADRRESSPARADR